MQEDLRQTMFDLLCKKTSNVWALNVLEEAR